MPNDIAPNIGERGAARRARTGRMWAAVSVVAAIVVIVLHATAWAWLVVPPVALAVLGRLQARERT